MSALLYADTSLLVSLYLADANTPAALAAVSSASLPLILTPWQQFEMENALQLRLFRRESTVEDLHAAADHLSADLAAGAVVSVAVPIVPVLSLARRLTARHTALLGTRAFDVFHVAAALHLQADAFMSFDHRQVSLARASGLRVP